MVRFEGLSLAPLIGYHYTWIWKNWNNLQCTLGLNLGPGYQHSTYFESNGNSQVLNRFDSYKGRLVANFAMNFGASFIGLNTLSHFTGYSISKDFGFSVQTFNSEFFAGIRF